MDSFFTSDFFIHNRLALRQLFASDAPMVFTANSLLQRNSDIPYTFRQDSSFWYLTGLNLPGSLLVMHKDTDVLILPELTPIDEVFGAPANLAEISNVSGISDIRYMKEGLKWTQAQIKTVQQAGILTASPVFSAHNGFYSNPARRSLVRKLRSVNPDIDLLDLRQHLMKMRMIKQVPELAAIKKAVDITVSTLQAVEQQLATYTHEYQIEADLTHGYRSSGASGHAFSPIVAGGKNTCHLHYERNNDSLKNSSIIYIDTGAEVENYSADVTRTYILKKPAKRELAVIAAVADVARFAQANLKPGITLRENEKAVEDYMGEKLMELGLITSVNRESVRKYYTHACSHYLGLDTHDTGDYDAPLEPNMVLTVEPGIYIPEEGIGVRIEDDVLITPTGIDVLSSSLPMF